jgi:penicillin-binding protein 1C
VPTSLCPHKVYDWLPEGEGSHAPPCSVHERLRVDLRNGRRAGPDCGPDVSEERTFERWPAPYDAWAKTMGRPLAPEESSPLCPVPAGDSTAAGAAPRISYPFDGARFVIDPERPISLQVLPVRVNSAGGSVDVRVDGTSLGPQHEWELAPGEHTIVAVSAGKESAPVRIRVR